MAAPLALIVTVEIDPARLDDFIKVMQVDCAGSRKEEGCYRFDLLRDTAQANKFVFYEVYKEPLPQARAHTRAPCTAPLGGTQSRRRFFTHICTAT
jgi:quinol monooxygenase YgiN